MATDPISNSEFLALALERYEAPLVEYATRILGDVEHARDVVQDTFLKLCRAGPGKVRDHLAQWLFTVCRNRAYDVRRKEGRDARPLHRTLALRSGRHRRATPSGRVSSLRRKSPSTPARSMPRAFGPPQMVPCDDTFPSAVR